MSAEEFERQRGRQRGRGRGVSFAPPPGKEYRKKEPFTPKLGKSSFTGTRSLYVEPVKLGESEKESSFLGAFEEGFEKRKFEGKKEEKKPPVFERFVALVSISPPHVIYALCKSNEIFARFCKESDFWPSVIKESFGKEIKGATRDDYTYLYHLTEISKLSEYKQINEIISDLSGKEKKAFLKGGFPQFWLGRPGVSNVIEDAFIMAYSVSGAIIVYYRYAPKTFEGELKNIYKKEGREATPNDLIANFTKFYFSFEKLDFISTPLKDISFPDIDRELGKGFLEGLKHIENRGKEIKYFLFRPDFIDKNDKVIPGLEDLNGVVLMAKTTIGAILKASYVLSIKNHKGNLLLTLCTKAGCESEEAADNIGYLGGFLSKIHKGAFIVLNPLKIYSMI